jgi:hypothetical protein
MSRSRKYKDYIVELRNYEPDSEQYEIALTLPKGEGEPTPVRAQLDYSQIETALNDLEAKQIEPEDLLALGRQLMDRLLPKGVLREHLVNAVKKAGPDGGIRLRLQIREPRLAQIPWEYCYLRIHEGATFQNNFLLVNPQVSMVRHVPLDEPAPELSSGDPSSVRMLAVFANPEDSGFRQLDLDEERGVLEQALGDFSVEGVKIEWQPFREDVTIDEMNQSLLEKPQIFHFSGHGQFKERDDQGSLVLLKDKGSKEPYFLPAGDLALKLQAAGVRLAVLGACKSSRYQARSAWTGVAPALVARGVGAVIAMQYDVIDSKAILFSQGFYRSLAAGLTVDEAVSVGRLAMLEESGERGVEWGVPTLYLRSDGVLFPQLQERETALSGQLRLVLQQIVDAIDEGSEVIGIEFKAGAVPGDYQVIQNVNVVKGGGRLVGASIGHIGGRPDDAARADFGGRPDEADF